MGGKIVKAGEGLAERRPMRLEVRHLSVRRGDDLLLENLSFGLSGGQALMVTGKNGSGKSTLLRAIPGLLPIESGEVMVRIANQSCPYPGEACHYLGHLNAMKREMSVYENLAFWKAFMGDFTGGHTPSLTPQQAADQLGLGEIIHLPYGYLSAGQQRRMAMARLLVAYRPIWLLDEPTAALDAASEKRFSALATDHISKGGIVIAATHQPLSLIGAATLEMTGFVDDKSEEP